MINYDNLVNDYARHRKIHPGVLWQLIEHGDVTANTRVLEVGCGTGNYLTALNDATGCAATGVDPSEAMLATARERSPHLTWQIGRGEMLPVADASFDLVFSVDVIHHIDDRPSFFAEVHRVLAPGGQLCTATDSEEDILRRRPLSSHFPETVEIEFARYPRIEILMTEMRNASFRQTDVANVELAYELTDAQPYRDRAFSSLHLIEDDAFNRGIARLDEELARSTVQALSLYTLLWGAI